MFSQPIFHHPEYDLCHVTPPNEADYYALILKNHTGPIRGGALGCIGSGDEAQKKVAYGMESFGELPPDPSSPEISRNFPFLPTLQSPPIPVTLTAESNSLKPHLYFVLGDFIYKDGIPFEEKVPTILASIKKYIFEMYGKSGRPFFFIPGNHDAGLHTSEGRVHYCDSFNKARDKLDATVKAIELVNTSFYLIQDPHSPTQKKFLVEHIGNYHGALKFLGFNPEKHPEINNIFTGINARLEQQKNSNGGIINKVMELNLNIEFVQKFYEWAKPILIAEHIQLYRHNFSSQFFFPKRNYWLKVYNSNQSDSNDIFQTKPEANFLCLDSNLLPVETCAEHNPRAQKTKIYFNSELLIWLKSVFFQLKTEKWILVAHHYFWPLGERITETGDGERKYFSSEIGTQNQLFYKALRTLAAPLSQVELTLSAHEHFEAIIGQSPSKNPAHIQGIGVISGVGGSRNHEAYFIPPNTCHISDQNRLGFHIITLPLKSSIIAESVSPSDPNMIVEYVDCSTIWFNSSNKANGEVSAPYQFKFNREGHWLNFLDYPQNFPRSLFYRKENSSHVLRSIKEEKLNTYNQTINECREFIIFCLEQNNLEILKFFIFGLTNLAVDFDRQQLDKIKLQTFISSFFPKQTSELSLSLGISSSTYKNDITLILENLYVIIEAFIHVDKSPDLDQSAAQICLIYHILWEVYQCMTLAKCSLEIAISKILHRPYLSRAEFSLGQPPPPYRPTLPSSPTTHYQIRDLTLDPYLSEKEKIIREENVGFFHSGSDSEEESHLRSPSTVTKTTYPAATLTPLNPAPQIPKKLIDIAAEEFIAVQATLITLKENYQKALQYACLKACQDYLIQFFGIEKFTDIYLRLSDFPQVSRVLLLITLLEHIPFAALYTASQEDKLLSQLLVKEILIHRTNIFNNFVLPQTLSEEFTNIANPQQREQLACEYFLNAIIKYQGKLVTPHTKSLQKLFLDVSVSQLVKIKEIKDHLFKTLQIENVFGEIELLDLIIKIENKLKALESPALTHWSSKLFSCLRSISPPDENNIHMNKNDVEVFLKIFFESRDKSSFILNIKNRFPSFFELNTVMIGTQTLLLFPPEQKKEGDLLLNSVFQNDPIAKLLFQFVTQIKPECYEDLKEALANSQSVLRFCPQAGAIIEAEATSSRKSYNTFGP